MDPPRARRPASSNIQRTDDKFIFSEGVASKSRLTSWEGCFPVEGVVTNGQIQHYTEQPGLVDGCDQHYTRAFLDCPAQP
ncbi:hypothetical protein PC116_g23105 [Phytophthora cactorum]|uniref:Uncharacterized protein n=1 Tax=Phytophthora cactorum TaxID=29920 RepID=A0A8T1FPD9_9STRA|nr:hypothetical protein PC113_g6809 [Phytophthora cactorum]KAG2906226.1 hypothetical protein PC117_g20558 [Phytophthora cactorum]KAG2921176.1 hypothetical protein PC115_g9627 [Phytophthora cactorum]KAG2976627.1 hypothetical protein PC118_g13322 [Phytophthora cactorum]KAG3011608.1 hypothetical protein PC119_g13190 [Phytophthora cactorum]